MPAHCALKHARRQPRAHVRPPSRVHGDWGHVLARHATRPIWPRCGSRLKPLCRHARPPVAWCYSDKTITLKLKLISIQTGREHPALLPLQNGSRSRFRRAKLIIVQPIAQPPPYRSPSIASPPPSPSPPPHLLLHFTHLHRITTNSAQCPWPTTTKTPYGATASTRRPR